MLNKILQYVVLTNIIWPNNNSKEVFEPAVR